MLHPLLKLKKDMHLASGEAYLRIYLVHRYISNANSVQASGWHWEVDNGPQEAQGSNRACQVLKEREAKMERICQEQRI